MSDAADLADLEAVGRQLGRPARGVHAVAHRCPCGLPDVVTTEGEVIAPGSLLGTVESLGRKVDVTSAFHGFLMGMLALPGERVRAGQPIAWLHAMGHE